MIWEAFRKFGGAGLVNIPPITFGYSALSKALWVIASFRECVPDCGALCSLFEYGSCYKYLQHSTSILWLKGTGS